MEIRLNDSARVRLGKLEFGHVADGALDDGLAQVVKNNLGDQAILGVEDPAWVQAEARLRAGDFQGLAQDGWQVSQQRSPSWLEDGQRHQEIAQVLVRETGNDDRVRQKTVLTVTTGAFHWDRKIRGDAPEGAVPEPCQSPSHRYIETSVTTDKAKVEVVLSGRTGTPVPFESVTIHGEEAFLRG